VAEAVTALLAPTGVTHVLRHVRGVPPVVNERTSTRLLRAAVADGVGESAVAPTLQSSGGEDFAWYLERVPGAMGRLGVWPGTGPQLDLHQPTFDLDERALEVGVRTLVHCALETWALETRALETRPLRPAVRG
jgi:metal-dependent amidase/aminoacylase/carboxypeptidase family protein